MSPKLPFVTVGLLAVVAGCATTPAEVTRVPTKADARFTMAYLDASQVDVPPRPTRAMAPPFVRHRGDGYAIVQYLVDTAGTPREVQCVEASDAMLGRAAETTIAQWRFDAAEKDGRAVASRMEQRFEFRHVKPYAELGSPAGDPLGETPNFYQWQTRSNYSAQGGGDGRSFWH